MTSKYSKFIYSLARDGRITTKRLGKETKKSQQSASYLLGRLQEKGIIKGFRTIADPSRLGLHNVIVLYNFKTLEHDKLQMLKAHIRRHPYIVNAEEIGQGADLLLEYCVPNLSFFNKQHMELLHHFRTLIKTGIIYVVIVKHLFEKKYLIRKREHKDIIICGDRETHALKRHENDILYLLNKDGRISVADIARKTKLSVKQVMTIKKRLEKDEFILKYTAWLNFKRLNIRREFLFIRPAHEDPSSIRGIVQAAREHPNVVETTKVLGNYELLLVLESADKELDVINDLRKEFQIQKYKTIVSKRNIKFGFLPEIFF